jgi:phenylacetate-CoA ligase
LEWPTIPRGRTAQAYALVFALELSQWFTAERLLARQLRQLEALIRHGARTSPYFRDRLAPVAALKPGTLSPDAFRTIPVLGRADIQDAGDGLHCETLPDGHGKTNDIRTSGSTGQPVHVKGTELAGMMNAAVSLRYHLWHRRDLTARNITVKALPAGEDVRRSNSWVVGMNTGPAMVISNGVPVDRLFDMVVAEDPEYLQCHPHTLREMIRRSRALGVKPAGLREARTSSEVLDDELREMCRTEWGIPATDNYSSEEFGIMSLQCPDHPWGHVQSEKVLLEVLDEDDRPCPPGRIGRVVVTSLHNYATPLIRYEIGDYGELGPPCPCGRGLPVLRRIAGRERNMVVLPTGERLFPIVDSEPVLAELPIRQFQMTQKTLDEIHMTLVTRRPLEEAEEAHLTAYFQRNFRHPFRFVFHYVDEIPRAPGGKYELFRSEVGGR